MAARTGWAFTVLAGGPDTAKDGEIRSIGIHIGQDQYGNSFGKSIPNFTDTILKPYSAFLHAVYPKESTIDNQNHLAPAGTTLNTDGAPKPNPDLPGNLLPAVTQVQPDEEPNAHRNSILSTQGTPAISSNTPMIFPIFPETLAVVQPDEEPNAHRNSIPSTQGTPAISSSTFTAEPGPLKTVMAPTMGMPMYETGQMSDTQIIFPIFPETPAVAQPDEEPNATGIPFHRPKGLQLSLHPHLQQNPGL